MLDGHDGVGAGERGSPEVGLSTGARVQGGGELTAEVLATSSSLSAAVGKM